MEHELLSVKALEWRNVAGVGQIAVIDFNELPAGRKLLPGDKLYIDDRLVLCREIHHGSGSIRGIVVRDIQMSREHLQVEWAERTRKAFEACPEYKPAFSEIDGEDFEGLD